MSVSSHAASIKVSAPDRPKALGGRFTDLSADKLRGGYYTSDDIAAWICRWAVQNPGDHVLEPSCGDGVFVKAALHRLDDLGADGRMIADQVTGVEIIPEEAGKARNYLQSQLGAIADDAIETGDFFQWWNRTERSSFDVVVGNPPFIRYQTFPEPHRSRAMEIMKELGLSPNRLTNIWVPFVVASAALLRPGGRMAFILPAELLQVSYASQLRSFLTDRFARLDLITCNELFFNKAEQEVVILFADGARAAPSDHNRCQVTMTQKATASEILQSVPSDIIRQAEPKTVCHDSEKWLKYFLSPSEISFMRELRSSDIATPFSTFASVRVGVVTGRNQYFVMNQNEIDDRNLSEYMIPLVSRAAHLVGSRLGKPELRRLSADNQRVHLLDLNSINGSKLPPSLDAYIKSGESQGVHEGYKCSIRTPWYAVPSIWTPDAFLFRQIYDFPRAVLNNARATCTDTIHRIKCKANPRSVIANTYTHLTAASAEIEGRSYGGGVLELEPTEAERMLVPAKLGPAVPLSECDRLVRDGRLSDVLEANDRLILIETLGLTRGECLKLKRIWEKMRDRRLSRRRNGK